MSIDFHIGLIDQICAGIGADHQDNFDYYRFDAEPPRVAPETAFLQHFIGGLERLFDELADSPSRQILLKLIAYRILGHRRVRLPLSTPDYWNSVKQIERIADSCDYLQLAFHNWKLHRFPLDSMGLPLVLYSTPMAVHTQFFVPQYGYKAAEVTVRVELGDTVIDAGGGWGDSSLFFALNAGGTGRVFCFEPVPENLSIIQRNLALNAELARRVQVVDTALSDVPSDSLSYEAKGPASRMGVHGGQTARALSIDGFVQSERLQRVDFIKMDIEGWESKALAGAVNTLRTFRPKLAIAVYHSYEDLTQIPEWIRSLDLGYRLYLGHASVHQEETVLFATR